jgi:hypothetical protein
MDRAMTMRWNIKNDHLISRWCNGESTFKYDSDWIKDATTYEGQRRTDIVDISLLSPFGGGTWYAHALWERLQLERCLT